MENFPNEEQAGGVSRRTFLKGALVLGLTGEILAACDSNDSTPKPSPDTAHNPTVRRAEFESQPSWQQDFVNQPSGPPDQSVWRYELNPVIPTYNNEAEAYTDRPDNVRVQQGVGLILEAHRDHYVYPEDGSGKVYNFTSGRIDTKNSFSFSAGKLVATMKLPGGAGSWPAFWLLSANQPYSQKQNGEIDIMEEYGKQPAKIEGTVHTASGFKRGTIDIPDCTTNFHRYGIELTSDRIVWTVDDKEYFGVKKREPASINSWPFGTSNRLYAILNLAMGGTPSGPIDPSRSDWQMVVQNLSYYKPRTSSGSG